MTSFLLGRRTPGRASRPAPQSTEPDSLQLDWEFGDLLPADTISLRPIRGDEDRRFQPEPAVHDQSGTSAPVNGSTTPFANVFTGPQALLRLRTLTAALDSALDDWWSESELPPVALLRDGLLALEAGHELDEGHRTMLLRAAFSYRKGVLTALRHQTDDERTAFVLKEALLDVWSPLPPTLLWRLQQEDPASCGWVAPLIQELEDELLVTSGVQQELAARAYAVLTNKSSSGVGPRSGRLGLVLRPLLPQNGGRGGGGYWSPGRLLIMILLAAILAGGFLWRSRLSTATLVPIPGGDYPLASHADSGVRVVALTPFAIDRTEVTNANYRQCVNTGHCPQPSAVASTTRTDYATNPVYDDYPVVNVPWAAAVQFCDWLDKRLPTAEEWEAAAGFSPIAQRSYRYPWGDLYQVQLANVHEAQIGDTQPVGSYRPYGDSPAGLADMAGNVAEWTASPAPGNPNAYLIKGGSFLDGATGVQVNTVVSASQKDTEPWLGFRCAVDLPP